MTDTKATLSPDDAIVEAVANAFERYDLIDGDDSSDGFKAKWFIIDNDIDDDGRDMDLHEKAVHSEYRKGADEDALRQRVRLMNAQNAIRAYLAELEKVGWTAAPRVADDEMSDAGSKVEINMYEVPHGLAPIGWMDAEGVYSAMIAAAPKAPGAGGEG